MDNNFDDKLRNILSNPPDFPVDKDARADFMKRLDTLPVTPQPKRNMHWGRTMIWLALLLLSSGIGYLFSQNQNLKTQLVEIQQSRNSIVLDTIFQKHVTVIYDTVYISKTNNNTFTNGEMKSRSMESSYSVLSNTSSFPIFFEQKSKLFNDVSIVNAWHNTRRGNNHSAIGFENQEGVDKTEGNLSASNIPTIENNYNISLLENDAIFYVNSNKSMSLPELSSELLFDFEKYERKLKRRKRLHMMQPKSFALGIQGGLGYDLSLDFYDVKQTNYILGVDAEIGFGKNFALVIGANYRNQNFKLEGEYDNQPISLEDFPVVQPQDIDDELHEIYWSAEYLEIPFGFKFSFLTNKKIQPYLGFGLMSRKALKSKVEFEYYDSMGEEYKENKTGVLSSEFKVNNAWGTLGAQFKVTNNWRFFLEGGYQFGWQNKDLTKLEAVQLIQSNAGILYQF